VLALAFVFAAPLAVPGWPELFPELSFYGRHLDEPVVEKGDKPAVYSQSARYTWEGRAFDVITVTLARDSKFKDQYSAERMKQMDVQRLEIDKKPAYLWDPMAGDPGKRSRRLVVVLADDKVLLIEQLGHRGALADVAKMFDLDKVTKALDNPPPVKQK
jgi:hypothetical protein